MKEEDEEQLRQEAVKRLMGGESGVSVTRSMNRSRAWLYKWLKRYRSGQPDWYVEHTRAPHKPGRGTACDIEGMVVQIRARLQQTKYAQIGANAINWELSKLGHSPLPTSTINSIIHRHGLVRETPRCAVKAKNYPALPALFPNSVHQMDLVGPRFIKGDGRWYSLNVIDMASHWITVNPMRTKEDHKIAQALIRTWKTLGIPDFVQMDNELSFRGSNRHPHSLGLVLRLCLAHRVQPIFIPVGEPWRNGTIERFQNTFDKTFFRAQFFPSFLALCEEASRFEHFHNTNHVYSATGNRTPSRVFEEDWHHGLKLAQDYELPKQKIPVEPGYVHFIRFIRSDRKLTIFGEQFAVSDEVVYEYVWATLCTDENVLIVKHDDRQVHCFPYWLPEQWVP